MSITSLPLSGSESLVPIRTCCLADVAFVLRSWSCSPLNEVVPYALLTVSIAVVEFL